MNRDKAKEILFKLSTPEERNQMTAIEVAKFNTNLSGTLAAIQKGLQQLAETVSAQTEAMKSIGMLAIHMKSLRSDFKDAHEGQIKSLQSLTESTSEGLKNLSKTYETVTAAHNQNAGPLYKTMINHLAGMNQSFKNWKYPQYAAVSMRDKNFSNVNPAINTVGTNVGVGTVTVTTAGTAVQLSATSVPCTRVVIQAHESNTNPVTVGDSTVVGALSGRKGWALYPTNAQQFNVSDLNLLYVDAVTNGDKVHFFYENVV